jgi:hypothetical protein
LEKTSRDSVIDYLVELNFPTPIMGFDELTVVDEGQRYLAKRARYESELHELSREDLDALFEKEKAKEAAKKETERLERTRVLGGRSAGADFCHWSRASYWTLDEAIALSLGKEPGEIDPNLLLDHAHSHQFAKDYVRRRDLIVRAKNIKELSDPTRPHKFVDWANRHRIELPQELVQEVRDDEPIVDWKAKLDVVASALGTTSNFVDEALSQLLRERDRLSSEIDRLSTQSRERGIRSRERETMLKIIIGLAIGGYGYPPSGQRSPVPKELANDLEKLGIKVSDDTIRNLLNEARDLLPPLNPGN